MRSFINFNGLTAGDITERLFLWFFGPGFATFFFVTQTEWWPTLLGEAFVGVVVYRDAAGAGRRSPAIDAAIALIPFFGWWRYGRARGVDVGADTMAGLERPGSRMWDLRWSRTIEVDTALSVAACVARI